MATDIPTVNMKREANGWMLTCSHCDFEEWRQVRPAADRTARAHETACMKKRGR